MHRLTCATKGPAQLLPRQQLLVGCQGAQWEYLPLLCNCGYGAWAHGALTKSFCTKCLRYGGQQRASRHGCLLHLNMCACMPKQLEKACDCVG